MVRTRYLQILWFFARAIFHIGFWDLILPRLGMRAVSVRTRPKRLRRIAASFRGLATQMGGVMIKIGQFLSARADIFPIEITDELAGLQDEVPASKFEEIRKVAEADFGMPLEQRFAYFEPLAVAAASLGQVHRACLYDWKKSQSKTNGTDKADPNFEEVAAESNNFLNVVVKIQRPQIEVLIATDLAALWTVGKWLQQYKPIRKRADVPALLEEFERILYQEIDYLHEGRNIEIFAENFEGFKGVRVPKVVWPHTTRRVLTLEDVGGIKINDYEAITAAGISRRQVAGRLLDIYFKQIFEDGFFHADPHPGNLFVKPYEPSPEGEIRWDLVLVDFGMVGTLHPDTRHGLREMLIAIATRDSPRLIQAYQDLHVLLPGADLGLLDKANARVFDRFWGKNMSELREISQEELQAFIAEFRELVFSLPFQIPHNLIYLARTVGLLSGLCTGLDPQFNAWDHMAPYAQKLVFAETAPHSWGGLPDGLSEAWREFTTLVQRLVALPMRAEGVLAQLERGELTFHDPLLSEQVIALTKAIQLAGGGITFALLLISAIQLYLNGLFVFSGVILLAALLFFIWMASARLRKSNKRDH